ncbi:MAG: response regulator [Balneolaceae bacterium]|nr:response regulator [Balneolaceae bacterium]
MNDTEKKNGEMKEYTILVVDDDNASHIMVKKLLGDRYNLVHVREAQEAIDTISQTPINLILSDIHMPEMTGLEFLESIMVDADKRDIPVLIMTNLPTVEKEKKALDLGAADFIDKTLFHDDKAEVLNRVEMKLVTNLNLPELTKETSINKKKFGSKLMSEALMGDFVSTTRLLGSLLRQSFGLDHISIWTISLKTPHLVVAVGLELPEDYGNEELKEEESFNYIFKRKKPYLSNNIFSGELGVLEEFSRKYELPAEMGVPLFALDEKQLIKNKMTIPAKTDIFGYALVKRNKVFTTKEYKLLSKLLVQAGTILWRLYKRV